MILAEKDHVLLLMLGKIGVGKDSIVDALCRRTELKKLMSYTTRPKRNDEDLTHIFTTKDEFDQMMTNGNVATYTEIAGNYYWSTIEQLYESDVFIIDYVGLKRLRELNLPNIRFVTVYIHVPDATREHRAIKLRGDDKPKYKIHSFSESSQFKELEKSVDYDYSICNIDLPKACSVFRWIAIAEEVLTHDKLIKKGD